MTALTITPHSAKWITSNWQEIEKCPALAINGFQAAGIAGVITAIRDPNPETKTHRLDIYFSPGLYSEPKGEDSNDLQALP